MNAPRFLLPLLALVSLGAAAAQSGGVRSSVTGLTLPPPGVKVTDRRNLDSYQQDLNQTASRLGYAGHCRDIEAILYNDANFHAGDFQGTFNGLVGGLSKLGYSLREVLRDKAGTDDNLYFTATKAGPRRWPIW